MAFRERVEQGMLVREGPGTGPGREWPEHRVGWIFKLVAQVLGISVQIQMDRFEVAEFEIP